MGKKPTAVFQPNPQKSPKIEGDPNSFYGSKPSWRLAYLEFCDPFGWHQVDRETIEHIRNRLADFERMTWAEIVGRQNHPIRTASLCKEAQQRLAELHLDDIDRMYSLRLTKKARIWGHVSQGIMTILWWDPEHQVYPVNITGN